MYDKYSYVSVNLPNERGEITFTKKSKAVLLALPTDEIWAARTTINMSSPDGNDVAVVLVNSNVHPIDNQLYDNESQSSSCIYPLESVAPDIGASATTDLERVNILY